MIKNGVSACSTDKVPAQERWYSCPIGFHTNIDYDIWCLTQGVIYRWEYVEHCAVFCIEFKTSEDLLAFRLTFKL